MPYGKGTYGKKKGRPSKMSKMKKHFHECRIKVLTKEISKIQKQIKQHKKALNERRRTDNKRSLR